MKRRKKSLGRIILAHQETIIFTFLIIVAVSSSLVLLYEQFKADNLIGVLAAGVLMGLFGVLFGVLLVDPKDWGQPYDR